MRRRNEDVPLHIKTVEELQQYNFEVIDIRELPWNYRVTAAVAGVLLRTSMRCAGHPELTRKLEPGEKEELSELLAIVRNPEEWVRLDSLRQLELRKRASLLADRASIDFLLK